MRENGETLSKSPSGMLELVKGLSAIYSETENFLLYPITTRAERVSCWRYLSHPSGILGFRRGFLQIKDHFYPKRYILTIIFG